MEDETQRDTQTDMGNGKVCVCADRASTEGMMSTDHTHTVAINLDHVLLPVGVIALHPQPCRLIHLHHHHHRRHQHRQATAEAGSSTLCAHRIASMIEGNKFLDQNKQFGWKQIRAKLTGQGEECVHWSDQQVQSLWPCYHLDVCCPLSGVTSSMQTCSTTGWLELCVCVCV